MINRRTTWGKRAPAAFRFPRHFHPSKRDEQPREGPPDRRCVFDHEDPERGGKVFWYPYAQ